jgi:agmatinase
MKLFNSNGFISCDASFKKSKFSLVGIPYDGTSSLRPGSRFAPDAIRKGSYGIETFSHEQEDDLIDHEISDIGNLEITYGSAEKVMEETEELAAHMLKNKKQALYIGGEHLLTYPILKKYSKKFKGLKVLYFDAHADMRTEFMGNRLSHANAARLAIGEIGRENLYMFGIRSFEKNEYAFIRKNNIFCDSNCERFNEAIEAVKGSPVYISLDMDIFDPACLPGLGTPEAGGIFYRDFIGFLPGIRELDIVGMDVLEVSPEYDPHGNSSIFAAKVIRELILATIKK